MKLLCLLESQGAGAAVAAAATRRGHTIVDTLGEADAVYARTCTFDPWRTRALDLIKAAADAGKPSLPTARDGALYDDKVAQVPVLSPWLPKTYVITNPEDATAAAKDLRLPFISKAAVGAASQNVRFVQTMGDAAAEVMMAFRGDGIPLAKGSARSPKPITSQKGYLLWQEFVRSEDGTDIRVVINGDVAYGLRRFIRSADKPFASGSGKREIITSMDGDPFAVRAFALAHRIAAERGFRWACFDFVQTSSITHVLEVSFSWVEHAYSGCRLFRRETINPTGETAAVWPRLAVEVLEEMVA